MELRQYIKIELNSANITEGLFGGNGIFGIFSSFFHKNGDSKSNDPISDAIKESQAARQDAIQKKIQETQDALKKTIAAKIKAHSAEEINRLELEKKRKVDTLKAVEARYNREKDFWKKNGQALTMDQRMAMLKKTDDMLDGIRKSASPDEMDNASRLAAVMHKYALNPETGEPWENDEAFSNYIKDNADAKAEIEKAHKAAGRTFKMPETKVLSTMFRDVYDETAPAVQTEGEQQTIADEISDHEDKKEDAMAYLNAKKAYDDAKDKCEKRKKEAKELHDLGSGTDGFAARFEKALSVDGNVVNDDNGHPDTTATLAKLNKYWKQNYNVELPSEIQDKIKGTTGGEIISDSGKIREVIDTLKENDPKFEDQFDEDGEQGKAYEKAYNDTVSKADAEFAEKHNPDDTDDSRIKRGKDLVNADAPNPYASEETMTTKTNELKKRKEDIDNIQKNKEQAIAAAKEQQKLAIDQLKSDKEAKDDPKLAKKIKDITAGCELGDTVKIGDDGKVQVGYYDEKGDFHEKKVEAGDAEGLEKYKAERDAALMKTNGDSGSGEKPKSWTKKDDGSYEVTVVDKDGKETTKSMSMDQLAVLRAQHSSAAETKAYVDDVKSKVRNDLSKIEVDGDGKVKLSDEDKKKLSPATQKVISDLENAKDDSERETILKSVEGDAAGDKKLKSLSDAFKKGDSSSKTETNPKDEEDDAQEGDERTDNDDDLEDETGDEEEKKNQDPGKVWKQRSYKRGNKSFRTKSYYNKKGDSISKEEFLEKKKNFEKNKQSTGESLTLNAYMKLIFG